MKHNFYCLRRIQNNVRIEKIDTIRVSSIKKTLHFLRDHGRYKMLIDLCGVDWQGDMEIVYHLLKMWPAAKRLRIKKTLSTFVVESVETVFSNANWLEREIWDMFGIYFKGHSDLRRILTDYGFIGHPLRKDFPLMGYLELKYDEIQKRIQTEPLKQ